MKRILSIIAAIALFIGLSPAYAGTAVFAEDSIDVNETNFPDENFKNWVIDNIGNNDSILTNTEITNITAIDVEDLNISNLKGIEYFTNLTELSCSDNELTSLDVSKLVNLKILVCQDNQLHSLDVSNLVNLQTLNCSYNCIESLDVRRLVNLQTLQCEKSNLISLDLSSNASLSTDSSDVSLDQELGRLDILGSSGAWTYDMSALGIDLSKVTIDTANATLNQETKIVSFTSSEKPSELVYSYATGHADVKMQVTLKEYIKNLDFTLVHNGNQNYTVSVDNVPDGKKLVLAVFKWVNMYDYLFQEFNNAINGLDRGHGILGDYLLTSQSFDSQEIENNKPFTIDSEVEKELVNGIIVAITDPKVSDTTKDSYTIYQMGMTHGPLDIGASSGNKLNAVAHKVTVTNGTTPDSSAYKNDTVALTAANSEEFDHWTSSTDGVVFADKNSADTTFTMLDEDVSITAVNKVKTYTVKISSGKNMTLTGETTQTGLTGEMKTVVCTADEGYYFPADYAVNALNGITVKRNSFTQVAVSGVPTADAAILLKDAAKKASQDAPKSGAVTDGKGAIAGTAVQMEYSLDKILWKPCTDKSTAVSAGTYYVRYASTDTENASEAVKVIVTAKTTDTGNTDEDNVSEKDTDDDYKVVNTGVK
jgi:hypothetical protein